MSIDLLHQRIRKFKNPLVLDFGTPLQALPEHLWEEEKDLCKVYHRFCRELLTQLKDSVAGVRFRFQSFALLGQDGLAALRDCLEYSLALGYYILMDSPQILSVADGELVAKTVFEENRFFCHGLLMNGYIGSDAIKPMLPWCKDGGKSLFVMLRSANKSAWELQDLLSGSRHVYSAAAETVSRLGEPYIGKCGYADVCGVVAANAPEPTRVLRTKHNRLFLLVDGLEESGGNTKNAAAAFDRFGFGGALCVSTEVTGAWKETDRGEDYLELAMDAVNRVKKNISRYISIL